MSLLVCLSGQIGSGKSSVSRAVAQELGCKRIGFGDFLRAELERVGGDSTSRPQLQELGQQRVATDPTGFCRAALAAGGFTTGADFVLDGVRHTEILQILGRLAAPSTVRLVYLDATELQRSQRVAIRDNDADFPRTQTHQVEAESGDALRKQADLVVDADRPRVAVVADCLTAIETWR